jgi:hypothetical protein
VIAHLRHKALHKCKFTTAGHYVTIVEKNVNTNDVNDANDTKDVNDANDANDANDVNDFNDANDANDVYTVSDPNSCLEERTHGTVEEISKDCQLVGFIRMIPETSKDF